MGSASVSSKSMLGLGLGLELPKNPVVAGLGARGRAAVVWCWCGGAARGGAALSNVRQGEIFWAVLGAREEFGSRRGLAEASVEVWRGLARVGGQNGALKIVRVHGSLDAKKSALLQATHASTGLA